MFGLVIGILWNLLYYWRYSVWLGYMIFYGIYFTTGVVCWFGYMVCLEFTLLLKLKCLVRVYRLYRIYFTTGVIYVWLGYMGFKGFYCTTGVCVRLGYMVFMEFTLLLELYMFG